MLDVLAVSRIINTKTIGFGNSKSKAQFRRRASAVPNLTQELSSTKARHKVQRLNQTFKLSSTSSAALH